MKAPVSTLPHELKAPLFVVLRLGAHGRGILPEILERAGRRSASNAKAAAGPYLGAQAMFRGRYPEVRQQPQGIAACLPESITLR
jgi:hypothetical protein